MAKHFANLITHGRSSSLFLLPPRSIKAFDLKKLSQTIIIAAAAVVAERKINTLQIAYVSSRQTTLFDKRERERDSREERLEAKCIQMRVIDEWIIYLGFPCRFDRTDFFSLWHFHLNSLQIRRKTIHIKRERKRKISLSRINSSSLFSLSRNDFSSVFIPLDCLHRNVPSVKNRFPKMNSSSELPATVATTPTAFAAITAIGCWSPAMNTICTGKIRSSVGKTFSNFTRQTIRSEESRQQVGTSEEEEEEEEWKKEERMACIHTDIRSDVAVAWRKELTACVQCRKSDQSRVLSFHAMYMYRRVERMTTNQSTPFFSFGVSPPDTGNKCTCPWWEERVKLIILNWDVWRFELNRLVIFFSLCSDDIALGVINDRRTDFDLRSTHVHREFKSWSIVSFIRHSDMHHRGTLSRLFLIVFNWYS